MGWGAVWVRVGVGVSRYNGIDACLTDERCISVCVCVCVCGGWGVGWGGVRGCVGACGCGGVPI